VAGFTRARENFCLATMLDNILWNRIPGILPGQGEQTSGYSAGKRNQKKS